MTERMRLVRLILHLPESVYDRLVERAGFRAIKILRDQGKGNAVVLNRLQTRDKIAFRDAYDQILTEAIVDWLNKQEEEKHAAGTDTNL